MLLVVMGIVISLVLSVASRSLSDISLSRQERENSSTFALAETGVEQALSTLTEGSYDISDSSAQITGNYTISRTNGFDMYVKEGETAQIDLTGNNGQPVVLSWVKTGEHPGTCTEGSGTAPAAIEIKLISTTGVSTHSYYNANGCALATNGFSNVAVPGAGGFGSAVQVTPAANHSLMRIKPLYNGTTLSVTGSNLTSQLYLIQSEASGGDARTDIEVKRTLDSAGSIFDYALFSGTTIIK